MGGVRRYHGSCYIAKEEYLIIHKQLDTIGHPTSTAEIKELNRSTQKRKVNRNGSE